ncbi:fatty acid amide hydrolase [Capsicum annuum]|uniref:fatty acid amide hydrolase n=1 Tax=Capsicum annuum TaxID=4072 RepID=UPI001FB1960A|nr:fatty acid amide hydrolase [Capsicum annuum]
MHGGPVLSMPLNKSVCGSLRGGFTMHEIWDEVAETFKVLPCLPNLRSCQSWCSMGSLRLGKYTEWFNDVISTDISDKCEDILNQISEKHVCKTIEIVIPELREMRIALVVSIGSEGLSELNPDLEDGYVSLSEQVLHVLEMVFLGAVHEMMDYSYSS